jgi:hypothetical protein
MKKIFFKTIKYLPAIICLGLIIFLPQISSAAEPLATSINQDYIKKPWTIVMWLINIISVALLIAIAIGTALRVENLYFKRLLPALIIGLILANFSFLICRIMIDVVQIPTGWIVDNPESARFTPQNLAGLFGTRSLYQGASEIASGKSILGVVGAGFFAATAPLNFPLMITSFIVFVLPMIILFVFLWFILMCRIYVIWFLVIMSPLAFFCLMIPMFQKLWQTWWSWFVKWLLLGFLIVFVLKIGIFVTSSTHNLGFSSNIGQWIIGVATVILAVYYIPFVFIGGGIMAAWVKAPGKIFSHGGVWAGAGIRGVGTAFGGKDSKFGSWLQRQGSNLQFAAHSTNAKLADELKMAPLVGGGLSAIQGNWYEKEAERRRLTGVSGAINRAINPEQVARERKKLEMGDYENRSGADFARLFEQDNQLAAAVATGDESVISKIYGEGTEEADKAIGISRAFYANLKSSKDADFATAKGIAANKLANIKANANYGVATIPQNATPAQRNRLTRQRNQQIRLNNAIRENVSAARVEAAKISAQDYAPSTASPISSLRSQIMEQVNTNATSAQVAQTVDGYNVWQSTRALQEAYDSVSGNPQQVQAQRRTIVDAEKQRLRSGRHDGYSVLNMTSRLRRQGVVETRASSFASDAVQMQIQLQQNIDSQSHIQSTRSFLESHGINTSVIQAGTGEAEALSNMLHAAQTAGEALSVTGAANQQASTLLDNYVDRRMP